MRTAVIILNHNPVEDLLNDLTNNYNIDKIIILKNENPELMQKFADVPFDKTEMEELASEIYNAVYYDYDPDIVVVAGEPRLCRLLVNDFEKKGIECFTPYSKRVSEDIPQPDGGIKKVVKFKYLGLAQYWAFWVLYKLTSSVFIKLKRKDLKWRL